MLKKTHALALTVATAGLLGFAAPMASAATMPGPGHLVNISNNQVPTQVCGNDVNSNGAGVQSLAEGNALVASLLSPGAATTATSVNNRGCAMRNNQQNNMGHEGRKHRHGGSSLVNVSDNQAPTQVCGNDAYTNGAGTQTVLYGLSGALSALSPAAITKSTAVNNRGCASDNNQQNNKHDGHRSHR